MPENFKYDVFLSHGAKDKRVMRELAQRLGADGLRVFFDDWEIIPKSEVSLREEQIQDALEFSRVLVLAISKHTIKSEWATMESATYRFRDPTNMERRFIPLRLDSAEMPEPLRLFAYVDWRKKAEGQYAKLLSVCKGIAGTEKLSRKKDELKLRDTMRFEGHSDEVWSVAIASDDKHAVSGSKDNTLRFWDLNTGVCLSVLQAKSNGVPDVALTADSYWALAAGMEPIVRVWDLKSQKAITLLQGHRQSVWSITLSFDQTILASGSTDATIRIWEMPTFRFRATLEGHFDRVTALAITRDNRLLVSSSEDSTIRLWDLRLTRCIGVLTGHRSEVQTVAVSADGLFAVSGAEDMTIRVWNLQAQKCVAILEGHTAGIHSLALAGNGRWGISASGDQTLKVWDFQSGECVATLLGHTAKVSAVVLSSDGKRALSASSDNTLRSWNLDSVIAGLGLDRGFSRYTNSKVLLVGDSGVGKSGLAYRLTENRFVSTVSTDAAWATQLKIPHEIQERDIEREVWLWDFAGQADYRLIHQLYMDETALAVLVFNPQSENPFEGLGQWDRDLQRAARRAFRRLLVAGRCDRGGLMVSKDSVDRFQQERGFADYIETSALRGTGCDRLRDAIIANIPWDEIPWTASPRIFRLLKDEIVKLKDEGKVLLRLAELKQQLELRLPGETFTLDLLRAVIGLLAGPGVVWQLEFGDFVLLQPEQINAYAAAVIRSVRAHSEEIGCIAEEDVLAGRLDYQAMKRLPPNEEQIVLRAMHQTFVDHGLCLREHTDAGTLLIFPSYFKRERPGLKGHPLVLVTYQFNGALDEIYATLVVRLHHTAAFERDRLWRFAADFMTPGGKRLGLKMTKKAEGAAELEVYSESGISNDIQVMFIRYVHEHLRLKAQDVVRLRHYVCLHCQTPVEGRRAIDVRLTQGFKDIFCGACGKSVLLWDLIEEKFASEEFERRVRELKKQANAAIDNESKELILIGEVFSIAGLAGHIYRQYTNSDHGIDGEIEFKDYSGKASGKRLYLQLKSGDSYLHKRKEDGVEIFTIKKNRWAEYWQQQAYPVMLVIRTSDGQIRWMNVTDCLKQEAKKTKQIVFDGEPFTARSVSMLRDRVLSADVS